jgi:hypothetical protein
LPLKIYGGQSVANLQQSRSNTLARLAFTESNADWVLPLDADEFVVAENRAALESELNLDKERPVTVCLRNYSPSTVDNLEERNPVRRIQHRKPGEGQTVKVMIPRALGLREDVSAGKGNHALYARTEPLPARPLRDAYLAHFSLRNPHQQVLRVVTAELQKLSRGRAHEGLDVHYRLGFQLLAEDADLFFSTVLQPPERLQFDPVIPRGGELRYGKNTSAFARSAQALLPFLERLARSHGNLVDSRSLGPDIEEERIEILHTPARLALASESSASFSGFRAVVGWQPTEGPIPEAFLPPFHWATAPETVLIIEAPEQTRASLEAKVLTYAEAQKTIFSLNGREIHAMNFARVNQMETLSLSLLLNPGENQLVMRHEKWIESKADPRKLALIFLRLRISF